MSIKIIVCACPQPGLRPQLAREIERIANIDAVRPDANQIGSEEIGSGQPTRPVDTVRHVPLQIIQRDHLYSTSGAALQPVLQDGAVLLVLLQLDDFLPGYQHPLPGCQWDHNIRLLAAGVHDIADRPRSLNRCHFSRSFGLDIAHCLPSLGRYRSPTGLIDPLLQPDIDQGLRADLALPGDAAQLVH